MPTVGNFCVASTDSGGNRPQGDIRVCLPGTRLNGSFREELTFRNCVIHPGPVRFQLVLGHLVA